MCKDVIVDMGIDVVTSLKWCIWRCGVANWASTCLGCLIDEHDNVKMASQSNIKSIVA